MRISLGIITQANSYSYLNRDLVESTKMILIHTVQRLFDPSAFPSFSLASTEVDVPLDTDTPRRGIAEDPFQPKSHFLSLPFMGLMGRDTSHRYSPLDITKPHAHSAGPFSQSNIA